MGRRLLLAEDSVTIHKVVALSLGNEPYDIISVNNGEDCLTRARELRPEVVLIDHTLARKTALEGIAKLQGFWASCGLHTSLEGLGITDNRYAEMAAKATNKGQWKLGNFVKLEQKDVVAIYELASTKAPSEKGGK